MAKPGSNFGLISGSIGLALCLAQTIKSHTDARNERERLQEAHEQKMHFLHEFHRQQLQAKEHEMSAQAHRASAVEMERRAREAERRVGIMLGVGSEKGSDRPETNRRSEGAGRGADGEGFGVGREAKEREVWRLLESAREDVDEDGPRDGDGRVVGKVGEDDKEK